MSAERGGPIDRNTGQSPQPLGWQGHGIDWEVYLDRRPLKAHGYDEDVLVAKVSARTRWGLNRRMRRAERRLGLRRNGVLM